MTKADKFNTKYNEIINIIDRIKDDLNVCLNRMKAFQLHTKAKSLYNYGNKNCYDVTRKVNPIEGIDKLDTKMDNLEWLIDAEQNLKDFVNDFDSIRKMKS